MKAFSRLSLAASSDSACQKLDLNLLHSKLLYYLAAESISLQFDEHLFLHDDFILVLELFQGGFIVIVVLF